MEMLVVSPSKNLAENTIVKSILEFIVGALAHWTDHLLKLKLLKLPLLNIDAADIEPATFETPFTPSPPHLPHHLISMDYI